MTTLYKKVGKRYKPVAEHEEWDSYPAGAHLVVCSPGSTLRRFNVDPDRTGRIDMTPPPCNCAHVETLVVWKRGDKAPIKQRHDRCIHPGGPHPMHEWCEWRTPKTEGAME